MKIPALFDTGSTYSCITPLLAKRLARLEVLPKHLEFGTTKEKEKVVAKEAVRLDFYIDNYRFSDEFMVVENLSEDVIIGVTSLQKWRLKLDFEHDKIIIDPRTQKLRLMGIHDCLRNQSNVLRIKKSY